MSDCRPTPIETLYSTSVVVVPTTFEETTTRDGSLDLGLFGSATTETLTHSTFAASQVLIPTSTIYATPSACFPSSSSSSPTSSISHSSSLTLTMVDSQHSTTRTTTAPILSATESAGLNSSLVTTQQQSTSTLVTAISTHQKSTVYLTLTATFSNPVTYAVSTQTATLIGESPSSLAQERKKVQSGPIAGGIVGGLLALALLGLFSFCLYRTRKRKRMDQATSDLNTVLAGGIVESNRSNTLLGGVSRNLSRNRLSNTRFGWGNDSVDNHGDGVQLQMEGENGDILAEKGSSEGEEEIKYSNPPSLLDNRDWFPTDSNANSVAGYIHGSSAGPHAVSEEGEETTMTSSSPALSRNPSDPRGLLTSPSSHSVQRTPSTPTLLTPQSQNGPSTPASPMSFSQGEDPLTHANFIPISPSMNYNRTSSPIQNDGSTSPYPSSAPNTLGRAVGRQSYQSNNNQGSSTLFRAGSDGGEMWVNDSNHQPQQMEIDEVSRPPRERRPSSPSLISMPVRSWSQSQQQFSNNGYVQRRSNPRAPPSPHHSNDFSPQKRHYSFNASNRPTSPFNNQRGGAGGQGQSSLHPSRPSSPNANVELPPSRYSHLDWPRPSPSHSPTSPNGHNLEGSGFFSQKARSYSTGLLPTPEIDLRNQSTSPIASSSFSNQSSKSNSPMNSRPSSRAMIDITEDGKPRELSTGLQVDHKQISRDTLEQLTGTGGQKEDSKDKKSDVEHQGDEVTAKDSEIWLDAQE